MELNLTPREVAVLVDFYQEAIRTAIATWPRTPETERRLQAVQARLGALLASEAVSSPLEVPDRPAVILPGGGLVVPGA